MFSLSLRAAALPAIEQAALRPTIVFHHDQEGRFIVRSGHSPRRGKIKFLYINIFGESPVKQYVDRNTYSDYY